MNTLTKLATATEVAESLAEVNPGRRFATSKSGSTVGVWSDEARRYIGCASLAITGQWALTPEGLPTMNGKPVFADEDWIPFELEVVNETAKQNTW